MGFFGEMFGGGRSHENQTNTNTSEQNIIKNELIKISSSETVHRDFHHMKNDWYLNDLWVNQEKDGTLPGLSFDYIIGDDKITDLFEDFPFATKLRKQNDGRYFCTTFIKEKDINSVDDLLYRTKVEMINKPDILDDNNIVPAA